MVTEGRLIVEFTFDDMMRVRTWHFAIRQFKELIPRSVIAMQVRARVRHRCAGACAKLSLNFQSFDTIMEQQVDNHSIVILCVWLVFLQQDPVAMEQLSKNITRQGLTNQTLHFLRVSIAAYMYVLVTART